MSTPISLDLEVTSPAAVALEIAPPAVDISSPDTDGAQVVLVAVPGLSGDTGTAGTVSETGTSATALSGHRAVTRQSDGLIGYASNDNPAMVQAPIWLTTGAAAEGASVTAVAFGPIDEPSWSWTPGPLYLGIDGALTQVPPTAPGAVFLARIGIALTATSVWVERSPSIQLY